MYCITVQGLVISYLHICTIAVTTLVKSRPFSISNNIFSGRPKADRTIIGCRPEKRIFFCPAEGGKILLHRNCLFIVGFQRNV